MVDIKGLLFVLGSPKTLKSDFLRRKKQKGHSSEGPDLSIVITLIKVHINHIIYLINIF